MQSRKVSGEEPGHPVLFNAPGTGVANRDRHFLDQALRYVEEHLDDSLFGVESLCRAMNMSHSRLHRRLKALTHQSAIQFIRNIRMQHARDLLRQGEGNISEVAYGTGFDDPGYFTKVFKRHFGFLPSERNRLITD